MARNPRVHIIGDWDGAGVKRAQRELGVFERQAAGFSSSFKGSMLGAGAALGGAFAVTSVMSNVVDFMRDAAGAAIADQKTMVALAKAMDNVGLSASIPAAEAGIKRMMLMTGIADDELRPALQSLVTATGNLSLSQKGLQTALDISAATGKDLTSVTTALSKASMGQMTALTRLGVPLSAGVKESKDFGAALDELNGRFGGQAAANADTYEGRIRRLSTAVDEAKETIGYGLLDAVDSVTAAFGAGGDGIGSFQDTMDAASQLTADFIRGVGEVTAGLANAVAKLGENSDDARPGIDKAADAAIRLARSLPGVNALTPVAMGLLHVGNSSSVAKDQMDALRDSASADDIAMQHLAASHVKTTHATLDQTAALESLNDATKEYLGLLDLRQSQADFRQSLINLDDTLKGNARSFKGVSDAAFENQQALRSAFTTMTRNAQTWQEQTGASADELRDKLIAGAGKIVDGFVAAGFKRKDIVAFLKSEGLWSSEWNAILGGAAAKTKPAATTAGESVGKALGMGVFTGLSSTKSKVTQMTRQLVAEALAAAQDESDSHSPSRKFAVVGSDMAAGLAVGLRSKAPDVDAAARLVAGIAIDAAKDVLKKRRADMLDALGAVKDLSKGIADQVLGNLNFQTTTTDAEGNAVPLTPEQMVSMMFGDIANQSDMVQQISGTIGKALPPALLQQILAMPPDVATALANYLGANPTMLTALSSEYQQLGTDTETLLGNPMGLAWAAVGDQSAKDMLAAARDLIAKRGDSFSQWVSSQLAVTIPVGFSTSGIPHMADGGIVTRPTVALIGEAGPEAIVPLTGAGSPAPVAGGGTTVYVTVQAPVGADLRRAGQEIAEALAAFEGGSGPIYVRAS